jgi:hypothetical protein
MSYGGTVKDNTVILDPDVRLPDGLRVVITEVSSEPALSLDDLAIRTSVISKMKAFGRRMNDRDLNLTEELLSEREELGRRA